MPCAPRCKCAKTRTFTQEYYESDKRYIGNAVQVFFKDGTSSPRIQVDYPIGHRKRRAEGMPVLVQKFETSVAAHFGAEANRGHQENVRRSSGTHGAPGERLHGADGERRLTAEKNMPVGARIMAQSGLPRGCPSRDSVPCHRYRRRKTNGPP